MNPVSLGAAVGASAYPGRGIIVGLDPAGSRAMIAYFIMGRSQNSRNRVFVPAGNGIRTQAFDASKLADPRLVIYSPVRVLDDTTICTNGDQTDTIYQFMQRGQGPNDALHTREYEPDPPIYTPRVSAVIRASGGALVYQLSILKRAEGGSCERFFYDYARPVPGLGHFIHTYRGGDPVAPFEGGPEKVLLEGGVRETSEAIWRALDEDNKVSLFVREIRLETGETEDCILNKNQ